MGKQPGRCIFCDGFGMSKEHLFADWLRQLFPRSSNDTHTVGEAQHNTPYQLTREQGHSGSKKARVVCEKCNNGWISELDNAAKAVAIPLIRGENILVTPERQITMATWLTKMTMVGDSRKRRGYISKEERTAFMTLRQPPNLWEIWLSTYEGTDYRDLALFQNGANLNAAKLTAVSGQVVPIGYLQTTTFGMGKTLGLVVGNDMSNLSFSVGTLSQRARRIWPLSNAFQWPLPSVLNDEDAYAVTRIVDAMRMNFRKTP